MRSCAIMQPTYFPWPGYFHLISLVDAFVFLDDVAYEKSSWQNRNRVLVSDREHWITVPARRLFLGQSLREVEITENNRWREKQVRLLRESYAKHPFFGEMMDIVSVLEDKGLISLAGLNVEIIRRVCDRLGLSTPFYSAHALKVVGGRSERLTHMCLTLGCRTYLSPQGAKDYLERDGFSTDGTVLLSFQDYVPSPYPQRGRTSFVDHLSILDVIANIGFSGAANYVRFGRV